MLMIQHANWSLDTRIIRSACISHISPISSRACREMYNNVPVWGRSGWCSLCVGAWGTGSASRQSGGSGWGWIPGSCSSWSTRTSWGCACNNNNKPLANKSDFAARAHRVSLTRVASVTNTNGGRKKNVYGASRAENHRHISVMHPSEKRIALSIIAHSPTFFLCPRPPPPLHLFLERERKRGEVSNKVSTAKRGGPGRVELCDTSPRRRSSSFILSRGGRAQHPFSFAPISFSFSLLFPSPCVLDLHRYRFALVVSLSPFDIRIDLTRPSFRI